jgi:hypothetical protein
MFTNIRLHYKLEDHDKLLCLNLNPTLTSVDVKAIILARHQLQQQLEYLGPILPEIFEDISSILPELIENTGLHLLELFDDIGPDLLELWWVSYRSDCRHVNLETFCENPKLLKIKWVLSKDIT